MHGRACSSMRELGYYHRRERLKRYECINEEKKPLYLKCTEDFKHLWNWNGTILPLYIEKF